MPPATAIEETGRTWRLVDTGPLDGAANMAVDEALLAGFDPLRSAPVLRLYGWAPPALSLGRFQDAGSALDLDRCAAAGIPVVRRITGGGIIYHAGEITYSLVCSPEEVPAALSVKESFRVLTSFLLCFYRKLGLSPHWAVEELPAAALGERTPFCFAGRESYDILVGGRKIGGNAQRRLKNVVFQHGSIPRENLSVAGSRFLRQQPTGLREGTVALAELGVTLNEERLKELLAAAFRESLGVSLEKGRLTESERAHAELLMKEKYGTTRWNHRGETGTRDIR